MTKNKNTWSNQSNPSNLSNIFHCTLFYLDFIIPLLILC